MTTMIVWLLINVSTVSQLDPATVTTVGTFPDEENCMHVMKQIYVPRMAAMKCVQARVVVPK